MLQEGLKCKHLQEKLQSIQRELKINNHKVGIGLNEDFIEIISSNSRKMTPFTKLSGNNRNACSLRLLPVFVIIPSLLSLLKCSSKIAFCFGGTTQYQQFTTSKCTHPKRLKKNSYNQSKVFEKKFNNKI